MRVVVDLGVCVGSGACTQVAPDVFRLDDAGGLRVLQAEPGEEHRGEVEAAAELCPTGAITVEG